MPVTLPSLSKRRTTLALTNTRRERSGSERLARNAAGRPRPKVDRAVRRRAADKPPAFCTDANTLPINGLAGRLALRSRTRPILTYRSSSRLIAVNPGASRMRPGSDRLRCRIRYPRRRPGAEVVCGSQAGWPRRCYRFGPEGATAQSQRRRTSLWPLVGWARRPHPGPLPAGFKTDFLGNARAGQSKTSRHRRFTATVATRSARRPEPGPSWEL
jgi:hypothetical protein